MAIIKHETNYYPWMTSNNAPAPLKANASQNTWGAFRAFSESLDDDLTLSGLSDTAQQWCEIQLDKPIMIWAFKILVRTTMTAGDAGAVPKDLKILGSNDGTNYTEIASFKDLAPDTFCKWNSKGDNKYDWSAAEYLEVPSTAEYQYYRFSFGTCNQISRGAIQSTSTTFKATRCELYQAEGAPEPIPVTSIVFDNPGPINLDKGYPGAYQFINLLPQNADDLTITVNNSDESIVNIETIQLPSKYMWRLWITPLKVGTTTITVTAASGVSNSFIMNITPASLQYAMFDRDTLMLGIGTIYTMGYNCSPEECNETEIMTFSGDNNAAFTVNPSTGTVTAIAIGTGTITATPTSDPELAFTATVEVLEQDVHPVCVLGSSPINIAVGKSMSFSISARPFENTYQKMSISFVEDHPEIATMQLNKNFASPMIQVIGTGVGTVKVLGVNEDGLQFTTTVNVFAEDAKPETLTATPTLTKHVGNIFRLSATVTPEIAEQLSYPRWSSPDTATLKIGGNIGRDTLATGLKTGTVTPTVTVYGNDKLKASTKITLLSEIIPTSMSMNIPNKLVLINSEPIMLFVTTLPEEAHDNGIVWETSDDKMAPIYSTLNYDALPDEPYYVCYVRPLQLGTVTITAKNPKYPLITATCTIEIVSSIEIPPTDKDFNKAERALDLEVDIYFDTEPITVTKHDFIVDSSWLEESSADAETLLGSVSSNEFSISLLNENGQFNPTNVSSPYYGKMRIGTKLIPYIHPKSIDDPTVIFERVKLGEYFVSEWDSTTEGTLANVVANDKLYHVINSPQPKYTVELNITYKQMIENIFASLGVPVYVDSTLDREVGYSFIEGEPSSFLTEIVQGILGICTCQKDGNIHVSSLEDARPLRATITDSDQIIGISAKQSITKQYDGVELTYALPQVLSDQSMLSLSDVQVSTGSFSIAQIAFNSGPMWQLSSLTVNSPTSKIRLDGYEAGPWNMALRLYNTGAPAKASISITGAIIQYVQTILTDEGASLFKTSNRYVQSTEYAEQYKSRLNTFVSVPVPVLVLTIRGNPLFNIGDKIHVQSTRYKTDFTGILQRAQYTYNGGLSCEITLLNTLAIGGI